MMILKHLILWTVGAALASTSCPPVEEGKIYSQQCFHETDSDNLVWLLESSTGDVVQVNATCPLGHDQNCTVASNDSFVITNNDHKHSHKSSLTFKVTKYHRNTTVRCIAVNPETGSRTVLGSCQLELFLKPQSPVCRAERRGENQMLVTCSTAKVYPGLKCQLAQRETQTIKMTNIAIGIEYRNDVQHDGYSRSSCSVLLQYLPPGSYQYFAVLTPDISTYVRNFSVPVDATRPVTISETSREVEIFLETPACPEAASGRIVVCEARGFDSVTSINLSVGGVEVKEGEMFVDNGLNGRTFRSRFLVASDTEPSHNLLCVVDSTENVVANQTTLGEVFTGHNSNSIELKSKSGDLILSDTRCHLRLLADASAQVTCSLGDTNDLTVEMLCVKDKQTLLNKTSRLTSVNVAISNRADLHGAECQCIARHVNGWIRQKAFFRIETISESDSRDFIIVLAVTISLLSIGVVCVILWYKIRRKSKPCYRQVSVIDKDMVDRI